MYIAVSCRLNLRFCPWTWLVVRKYVRIPKKQDKHQHVYNNQSWMTIMPFCRMIHIIIIKGSITSRMLLPTVRFEAPYCEPDLCDTRWWRRKTIPCCICSNVFIVFVHIYLLYFFVRVRVCAIVQFCICFIKNCVDDVFCSRRPLVDLLLAHVFVFLGVFVSLIVLS